MRRHSVVRAGHRGSGRSWPPRARRRFVRLSRTAHPKEWTLETADARRLPFADGAFSVVTAAYLLHVVDAATRREIINECRRVLRAGGRLVTVTPTLPRTRIARALFAPLAADAGSSVGPAAGFRPLDPRPGLDRATFTIAATRYVRRGYPSPCVLAIR